MIYRKISQSDAVQLSLLIKEMNDNLGSRILILDDIQDPGNLGTIIRSSVALFSSIPLVIK